MFRGYRLVVTQVATTPESTTGTAGVGVRAAWFAWGVAGCVLAVATFLFARLTAWPPHEDETLALFVGRQPIGRLLDIVLEERGGAPLHYLLAAVAAHSGGGLTALRLGSALFALASLPLIALLVARLAGRAVGLITTVLVSASWVLLFHGVYGRMYSLFLFTSALSYLALLWAIDRGGAWRFGLWGLAAIACIASHPYGALVARLAGSLRPARSATRSRGCRRVRRGRRARHAVLARRPSPCEPLRRRRGRKREREARLTAAGPPLPEGRRRRFHRRLVGAARPDPGARRVRRARALASQPPRCLPRRRAPSATPTLALLLARLGSSASPETRHLIFVLPFFMLLLATALVSLGRRYGRAVAACALAALVVAEVGWAYEKTPQLFTGDPSARVAAREAAGRWLAATSRPDDVFFGYEPLYLEASKSDDDVAHIIIPRADPKLAAARLDALPRPLGRGVWVFDAYDTNNCTCTRGLTISERLPHPSGDYEAARVRPVPRAPHA